MLRVRPRVKTLTKPNVKRRLLLAGLQRRANLNAHAFDRTVA